MNANQPKSTWVTRLEGMALMESVFPQNVLALQSAVGAQIESLAKDHPNYVVGLVSFESDVTIWGDGKSAPLVIAGGKLYKDHEIEKAVRYYSLTTQISKAKDSLLKKLFSLTEK